MHECVEEERRKEEWEEEEEEEAPVERDVELSSVKSWPKTLCSSCRWKYTYV